jgi:predicted nucleic acid-binding protein
MGRQLTVCRMRGEMRFVYDSGALIAAERRSSTMLLFHRRALASGHRPVVPTIVLGQVWRGVPREAALMRMLKGCRLEPLDVITAKLGGQLCGYTGTSDLADAVVAVLAVRHDAAIVTSDVHDLRRLTEGSGRKLKIFPV